MPRSEQLSQAQLFPGKIKTLTLKIPSLFQKNNAKELVARFILFLEARPLWQKIMGGLFFSLPMLITGIVLSLTSLLVVGACGLVFSSFAIALFEYYKKQHTEDTQAQQQGINLINDELSQLSDELNSFSKELDHYQSSALGDKTVALAKLSTLNGEKQQLESSLSDLSGRNKVLTQINESLMGENQALRAVVAEKIRLLVRNDQRIAELERDLLAKFEEKTQLLLELEKYKHLELSLRERIQTLVVDQGKQNEHALQQGKQIERCERELASLLKQRRYLVFNIKTKERDIASLVLSKQNLEGELAKSVIEQEQLRLIISELQHQQGQLKSRIKNLNLELFENYLSQEKKQLCINSLLNAGSVLQKHNDLLVLQLEKLAQENKLLMSTVASLRQVESELQKAKSKLQEVITGLQGQIKEQNTLLDSRKEQLETALADYQRTKDQLDETVADLALVKQGMITEVDKVKQTQVILTNLVSNLSKAAIKGEENNSNFLTQLQDLLTKKEQGFQQIAAEALGVNQRLTAISQGFEECVLRHKRLLQVQEHYLQQVAHSSLSFFAAPSEVDSGMKPQNYVPPPLLVS
ncbi:hypothetical protein [Legionella sp. km772]|uniref:hypothetical protein n=1 Tax=Legionella sp. km772 TaxID=2498111 RepID=UPI000F8E8637|nr:hypothetical protein [Legionella sp. km772]RUR12464.1 hypothetical protein ELY15_05090 [Legionella sp. km772]